jgi:hypothetical protein
MLARARVLAALVASLLAAILLVPAQAQAGTAPLPASATAVSVCPQKPAPGQVTCFAERYTGVSPMVGGQPAGYGPADLQSAYQLPSSTGGIGQTVYIIDAYDNASAESELATYRTQYGLPACSTANGCFQKLNQSGAAGGYPAANASWAGEIALDLDMVSAVCPNCSIRLIEAKTSATSDIAAAVNTAVGLGAHFVSLSLGGPEFAGETTYDSAFHHAGVLVAVSTGDNGWAGGVSYPAASPYVLAVGGTSLQAASNGRGWTETAWAGAGSGCSAYEAKPSWQSFIPDESCTGRKLADVSAVADPNTGMAVYHGGWLRYGGTSASAPIVAATAALTGQAPASDNPNAYPYSNTDELNDVVSGATGTCSSAVLCAAVTGWDGPTGLGTPIGIGAFSGTGSSTPVISVLTGSIAPASGVAGLPIPVSVTSYVPTGHTLASVAWTSAKADCAFADPTAASTTVSCNASDTGSTKVSAKLTDSAGLTKTLTGTLAFQKVAVKRAVKVSSFTVDGQDDASVCNGVAAPAAATVVDSATGDPIKGLTATYQTKATTATAYSTAGTAVTAASGTAVRAIAAKTSSTFAVHSNAAGAFAASSTVSAAVAVPTAPCTAIVTASASGADAWYGDTMRVSGTVRRADPNGSGTIPMGSLSVPITLTTPAAKVGAKPTVSRIGTAVTALDGTFEVSLPVTKAGELGIAIPASAGLAAASQDLGPVTVKTAGSTVDASMSAETVVYGTKVTFSGTLSRVKDAPTPLAGGTVALSVLPSGATKATSLGSAKTSASGAFTVTVAPTVSGEVKATYVGVTGTTGSTADLGALTVRTYQSSLSASAASTDIMYGDKLGVTGTLTKKLDSTTLPVSGATVSLSLYPDGSTKATSLGSARTTATGAFTASVVPKASGELWATYAGTGGVDPVKADLGAITVESWKPALTLTSSAASVATAGAKLTLSGRVTKTGASGVSVPAGVAVRLVLTPASGAPITLGTVTSNGTTGAFTLSPAIKVAGTITAQVVSVAGYQNASSPGVAVRIG